MQCNKIKKISILYIIYFSIRHCENILVGQFCQPVAVHCPTFSRVICINALHTHTGVSVLASVLIEALLILKVGSPLDSLISYL